MKIRNIKKKYLILGFLLIIALPLIIFSALSQTNLLSRANRGGVPVASLNENPPKPFVEEKIRGLVWAGLKANENARCNNAFEMVDENGNFLGCSTGPEPAPPGIDVTEARDTQEIIESVDVYGPASIPCVGDGTSGARVQMVYAVSSDQVDRYNELLPTFNIWGGMMDRALNDSAGKTGGERHIRFVTNPDCSLNILKLVLSPTADDSFSNMVGEMQTLGHTGTDRKYIIWADASVYCGLAQVRSDDKPTQDNLNNARTGYGRIDSGCWGRADHLTELHELFHTLGAVQSTAPHASALWHCSDEYDAMCYKDGSEVVMTYDCKPIDGYERILDCNNDDYFAVNPTPGSYLDTHWNIANSRFLSSEAIIPTVVTQAADKLEAENGIYKYPALFINQDGSASMGKYIQF